MEFQHVNVKLLVKDPGVVDLGALVPVFHGWIQNQAGPELLLDVADYRHVRWGPGIVLIGHEGNYSLDNTDGRLGVRYNCKAVLEGINQERLVQVTQAALRACQRLEQEPLLNGMIRFNGREIEMCVNDRLLAGNTEETRAAAHPEFHTFFGNLFGGGEFDLVYPQDSRSLFCVRATSSQRFDTVALLDNLSSLVSLPGPK
jgi:hypothetical protein